MNTKKQIVTLHLVRSIMILLMMGWTGGAWAQNGTVTEEVIYTTDFTDWTEEINRKQANQVVVNKETEFGDTFSFTLNGVGIYPKAVISSTTGYMQTAKYTSEYSAAKPSVVTSPLKSITQIKLHQAATGGERGIKVSVKGDGDAGWVVLHDKSIVKKAGEDLTLTVNRTNCQIKFENYSKGLNYNAYVTDLTILGNVEQKTEVTVWYYDTQGQSIGSETVAANTPLKYKYNESSLKLPENYVFRGWFNNTEVSATKVPEGEILVTDLHLYAKATPKETTQYGDEHAYDLTKKYFYPEDHDGLIKIDGGAWQNTTNGWYFKEGGTIQLQVAESASIDLPLCNASQAGTIKVYQGSNLLTSFSNRSASGKDGEIHTIRYNGGTPTTMTLKIPAGSYIRSLDVRNIKLIIVSFLGKSVKGDIPSSIKCDVEGKAQMPTNALFYQEGHTFQYWTDGENNYEAGETYAFTNDVTLTPKMTANKLDLTDTNRETTVTWPFDSSEAPEINMQHSSGTKGYTSTGSIFVDDNTKVKQDVNLLMDASAATAKINNHDARINALKGKGAQVNNGTIFTLSAVYGMKVTVKASAKKDTDNDNTEAYFSQDANDAQAARITVTDDNNYTIPASDIEIADNKTITFTYKGDATSLHINIIKAGSTKAWGFYESISATYPVLPNVVSKNSISNADPTNFPNEKNENAGTVNISSTSTHTNRGNRFEAGDVVTLEARANYGYTVTGFKVEGSDTSLPMKENKENTENPENPTISYIINYTITSEALTKFNNIIPIVVTYQRQEMRKVTAISSDTKLGSVELSPKYSNFYNETKENGKVVKAESWYTAGTQVTCDGETITDYMIDYWQDENGNQQKWYTYQFTMGSTAETFINRTFTAHFALGHTGSVSFEYQPGTKVDGEDQKKDYQNMVPELEKAIISELPSAMKNVRSFTIPTNYTLFKSVNDDGTMNKNYYTLDHWALKTDLKQIYELGKTYSFSQDDEKLVLVPVFRINPATQNNRTSSPVIRYDFGRKVKEYPDPNTGETRKVCAQAVNFEENKNVFWTSEVFVKVRESGKDYPHWRAAALWCQTGSKGFIRNTDLDNWCAFGPGTTFWFPSGTGTRISILSYSKITSTTIDGVVPTLDEERTDIERKNAGLPSLKEEEKGAKAHMYVYSYTTPSAKTRLRIIIGDDYSYYQWIELGTQAANWVKLNAETEDAARGKIDKIETVTKGEGHETNDLPDGGIAFRQGERVRMTLYRKKGYKLDKIVDPAKTDANGEPLAVLKMNDNGTVDMVKMQDASTTEKVKKNDDGTWGIASGSQQTVFVLKKTECYRTGETTYLAEDSIRTKYELEFDITNHRHLLVYFKEKDNTYYVTYNAGSYATGTPPEATWVEKGDKFTIPRNTSLYYEGNTLKYWIDLSKKDESDVDSSTGDDFTYGIGRQYIAKGENIRLYPMFKPNEFNILALKQPATATWDFTKDKGAPSINLQKTKGILVTQLTMKLGDDAEQGTVGGEASIDLKIDLDATNGKFDNTTERTERMQINAGSIISFPSTPNCIAQLVATEGNKKVKIAGTEVTLDDNYVASATCSGTTATQKLEFIDGPYSESFSVTYQPQEEELPEIETLTCGETTYYKNEIEMQYGKYQYLIFHVKPWANPDEKILGVTGTATNGGTVSATSATVKEPECIVTVKNKIGITVTTYHVKFEFDIPNDEPVMEQVTINDKTYPIEATETHIQIEASDVPANGVIKLKFNRTMQAVKRGPFQTESAEREHVFKYWDLEPGTDFTLKFSATEAEGGNTGEAIFKDIYGKECLQKLTIKLHIVKSETFYHKHSFNFIVGTNGTLDQAIAAANNNKTDGHRYYIFVPDGEYQLTGNADNGVTQIKKPNISLIGQSKEGVKIYNIPEKGGVSQTATLQLMQEATDFYAEDLTLENRFDYKNQSSDAEKQAAAFHTKGNRSVMKNVKLLSWQDTYYSDLADSDFRGYLEECDLAGVTDWICGNGNIWFEKCNLIHRDRAGNNIVAPNTEEMQEWGYVFNNCNIKTETEQLSLLKDKEWTLARPWGKSPACTFINTRMYTQPRNYGWGKMDTGLKLRFHEYNSRDKSDNEIPLATRSLAACSPAAGSDDCILSNISDYNLRNVLGGSDAFEPQVRCKQIDAASGLSPVIKEDEVNNDVPNRLEWHDNIVLNDERLQWQSQQEALCYFLFKWDEKTEKWLYQENTTECEITLTESGVYCVRAANQQGGLGIATKAIEYTIQPAYELAIPAVGNYKDEHYEYACGWTTICLPFNARVPAGVTAYAATAHYQDTETEKTETDLVTDFMMTLSPVEVINANKGYIVYGRATSETTHVTHSFYPTSSVSDKPTILKGNATDEDISSTNINCYVLAYKNTLGLGFYKFTGTKLKAHRAWLPQDMVSTSNQEGLAMGKRAIHFVFAKGEDTAIHNPIIWQNDSEDDKYYNLSGQRVETPSKPGIYISKKKGKKIIR